MTAHRYPPKSIPNFFSRQFTTSKLGRHTSSRETRLVSREIMWKSLTFTTDQVTKGISSCATPEPSDRTISASSTKSILDPDELNTSLHSSTTPSHLVGFRRFGSYPLSSQSRNQKWPLFSRHYLSAYIASLSSSESYGGSLNYHRQ